MIQLFLETTLRTESRKLCMVDDDLYVSFKIDRMKLRLGEKDLVYCKLIKERKKKAQGDM